MRLLIDACIDVRVARWLREAGHDSLHLRDEELHRLPDRDVFRKAVEEHRIILTIDLDFPEIVALSGGRSVSVIVLRLSNTTARRIIERVSSVLPRVERELKAGSIVVIEEARYRVRALPILRPGA